MIQNDDAKYGALFANAEGGDVWVSMRAFKHVIAKHRLKPKGGAYRIKPWMMREMVAFDKANGIAPPEVIEDVRRMVAGKAPIHRDGWERIDFPNDDDDSIH